ncbi:hypothetical protein B0H14DRAFT_3902127 [Mycena olivaceomarginata]|nr:hypothetical protein B0H14DRAFT_3902127 [Mycena olivaceomarginata]
MAGQRCRHHLFALPPRPRGRRRAPLPTPKHIALWAFSLFGRAGAWRSNGEEALHAHAHGSAAHTHSTDDLLARRSTASHGDTRWKQTKTAARARRYAGLAAVLAEAPGFPGSGIREPPQVQAHREITRAVPAALRPRPDSLAHLQAADGEDAADLDGPAYARLAPWGVGGSQSQSRNRPRRHARLTKKSKSHSKRSTKSHSSGTSSTLASPPPISRSFPHPHSGATEFGAFTGGLASVENDFDGTPGGCSTFNDEAAEGVEETEVVREALPSPELSRGAGGFRFRNGGGTRMGMGGFSDVPLPFGDPSG